MKLNEIILNYLKTNCIGKDNAITARELSIYTDATGRQIRESILELRRSGEPILSSVHHPYGFYLPVNSSELIEYTNQMYSRIREIYKTVRAVEIAAERKFKEVS